MIAILRTIVLGLFGLLFASGVLAGEQPTLRHEIEATLDPAARSLTLEDTMIVTGRERLRFRLAPWVTVGEITVNDAAVPGVRQSGDTWELPLPDSSEHRVRVQLQASLPPLPERPDRRGFVPPAASGEAGSFLSGRAGWMPVTDDERVDYRLQLSVPGPYRAIATGALVEEKKDASHHRAVVQAADVAELPTVFAGRYVVGERIADGIRLRTWFEPDQAGLSDGYLDAASRYLSRYSALIGAYPYPEFHIVSSPLPVGLGFPGVAYVGRIVLPLPFMKTRSLAHEVLHNWWGNAVAVDYAAGNWAEGLTTYLADHALAEDTGAEAARELRLNWLRDFAALPPERDQPVTAFTAKVHDAAQVIGYGKVAYVFHMLRGEIGETAFTEGLREFWRQNKFQVASWAALRRAFEQAAGRDLGWFFEQWLQRAGAARIELASAQVDRSGQGYRVTLALQQTAPAYRLSVPVEIETRDGTLRQRVTLSGPAETVSIDTDSEPLAVHVDPENDLFRNLLPGESVPILRDVTLATGPQVAVAATDPDMAGSAQRLIERLLPDTVERLGAGDTPDTDRPLVVVGSSAEVASWFARIGVDTEPAEIAGRGSARVWVSRRKGQAPVLVISADDRAALDALLRPLPHYRNKSYLVFEGSRAVASGVWVPRESPLSRTWGVPEAPAKLGR